MKQGYDPKYEAEIRAPSSMRGLESLAAEYVKRQQAAGLDPEEAALRAQRNAWDLAAGRSQQAAIDRFDKAGVAAVYATRMKESERDPECEWHYGEKMRCWIQDALRGKPASTWEKAAPRLRALVETSADGISQSDVERIVREEAGEEEVDPVLADLEAARERLMAPCWQDLILAAALLAALALIWR